MPVEFAAENARLKAAMTKIYLPIREKVIFNLGCLPFAAHKYNSYYQ
jgi:hypothetical protein